MTSSILAKYTTSELKNRSGYYRARPALPNSPHVLCLTRSTLPNRCGLCTLLTTGRQQPLLLRSTNSIPSAVISVSWSEQRWKTQQRNLANAQHFFFLAFSAANRMNWPMGAATAPNLKCARRRAKVNAACGIEVLAWGRRDVNWWRQHLSALNPTIDMGRYLIASHHGYRWRNDITAGNNHDQLNEPFVSRLLSCSGCNKSPMSDWHEWVSPTRLGLMTFSIEKTSLIASKLIELKLIS